MCVCEIVSPLALCTGSGDKSQRCYQELRENCTAELTLCVSLDSSSLYCVISLCIVCVISFSLRPVFEAISVAAMLEVRDFYSRFDHMTH